jgi:hypothetical protein
VKIFYILILFIFTILLTACAYTKPICPEVPSYLGVQQIGFEMQSASRIASYRTTDTPQQILAYYKDRLANSGWEEVSETQKGITVRYISSDRAPPFGLSVVITTIQPERTDFEVHLTISGPFIWNDWCQNLRP